MYKSSNLISVVEPGAFNGLYALTLLALSHSRIERLYVNMFSDLTSCTSLSVQGNRITEVEPGSFNRLSNVEILYLNINRLTTLNAGMFQGLVAVTKI